MGVMMLQQNNYVMMMMMMVSLISEGSSAGGGHSAGLLLELNEGVDVLLEDLVHIGRLSQKKKETCFPNQVSTHKVECVCVGMYNIVCDKCAGV